MVLMPAPLFLVIAMRDSHAEREESNYGVGEDISWGKKKLISRGRSYTVGWCIFFTIYPDVFYAYIFLAGMRDELDR